MRWVKPSMATMAPSWTYSAIASCSERNAVICRSPSEVEKRGLVRALKHDVKAVNSLCAIGLATCYAPGQQRCPAVGWDAFQHGIPGVACLIFKVHACHDVIEQSARKHGNADVRRLPSLSILLSTGLTAQR